MPSRVGGFRYTPIDACNLVVAKMHLHFNVNKRETEMDTHKDAKRKSSIMLVYIYILLFYSNQPVQQQILIPLLPVLVHCPPLLIELSFGA